MRNKNRINKEITRKRSEFDLETLDYVGQKLSEKRLAQVYTLLSEGELTIYKGVYETVKGVEEIKMQNLDYTLSSAVTGKYADMINNIRRAADVDVKISEEQQMEILVDAIAQLEGELAGSTLNSADKTGLEKAIELMKDAYNALVSYQN